MKKKLIQEQQLREEAIIESFAKTFNKIKRLDEQSLEQINEGPMVTQLLKTAKTAIESGSQVTVMDIPIGKVIVPAGALFPSDGSQSIRINNIENPLEDIMIDGQPIGSMVNFPEPKPIPKSEPKPFDTSIWTDPKSIFYRGTD